jgi:hypothetical protein
LLGTEVARLSDAFGLREHAALALQRASWHHTRTGDGSAAEAAFREAAARYHVWGATTRVDRLRITERCEVAG